MLTSDDLYPLEHYSRIRDRFRRQVIEHKKLRRVRIGEHATLLFEDRLTMQYQIQEMLRAERIFEPDGIQEELDAYNPLIPDGTNWKATMLIEFENVEERQDALARLRGIERRVWVQVGGSDKVWAIADEDLERQTHAKTSAVHFLRFELPAATAAAARRGEDVTVGIDHEDYAHRTVLPSHVSEALREDLH
jgi:hypothetical protein